MRGTKSESRDLASVISGSILKLYPKKFGEDMKPAARSNILTGKRALSREELAVNLDKIDIPLGIHLKNVKLAEDVIFQQYESTDLKNSHFTVLDFANIFFNNKDHRVYKELVSLLKLQPI